MFKNVSDVLFKSGNFKASLILYVTNGPQTTTDKFKRQDFISIRKNLNPNDPPSVYFDTYQKCGISLQSSVFEDGKSVLNESFYISQRMFQDLHVSLDVCCEWMRSKVYRNLFDIDSEGAVKGLGLNPPFNPSIYKNQCEYIRFYPAIVKDFNGTAYEGISIRSHKGPLVQLTCMEFLTFYTALKSYLNNSYGNNLSLVNLALSFAHMTKSIQNMNNQK